MRVVMFYHSLVSDWNHGNAHFLRGVAGELLARGHQVKVCEPHGGWSLCNLLADQGHRPLAEFSLTFPRLRTHFYDLAVDDVGELADGADLVIVHEWSDHELVRRLGALRAADPRLRLLFHDTHHRSVTDRAGIRDYDLRHYDGVLAFGGIIRDLYLEHGWAARAWTWHEAADTRVFYPRPEAEPEGDLVWVGNWGDGERSAELWEFLVQPAAELGLRTRVHGVRYPLEARQKLHDAGIDYRGWLPNYRVPEVFGRHRVTMHVPRRPYVQALPGIPTIRPFEAMACGIPLVSVPWEDSDGLFRAGRDYLVARDGRAMTRHLRELMADRDMAREIAANGRDTVLRRHTCAHRVDELLAVCRELRMSPATLKDHDHETTLEHRLLRL
jgi:spore maturation protein CgeB